MRCLWDEIIFFFSMTISNFMYSLLWVHILAITLCITIWLYTDDNIQKRISFLDNNKFLCTENSMRWEEAFMSLLILNWEGYIFVSLETFCHLEGVACDLGMEDLPWPTEAMWESQEEKIVWEIVVV